MALKFPSWIKMLSTDLKISMPSKVSTSETTVAHVVKLLNDKEKILKAAMEKQLVVNKGTVIILSANFQQKTYRPERTSMIYSKC